MEGADLSRNGVHILVIEDDPGMSEVVDLFLTGEGYSVVITADAAAAFESIRRIPPDIILLDYRLPGLSGAEFLRTYHELPGPHAPVLLCSALSPHSLELDGLKVAAVVPKPFDLADLLFEVQRHTGMDP